MISWFSKIYSEKYETSSRSILVAIWLETCRTINRLISPINGRKFLYPDEFSYTYFLTESSDK